MTWRTRRQSDPTSPRSDGHTRVVSATRHPIATGIALLIAIPPFFASGAAVRAIAWALALATVTASGLANAAPPPTPSGPPDAWEPGPREDDEADPPAAETAPVPAAPPAAAPPAAPPRARAGPNKGPATPRAAPTAATDVDAAPGEEGAPEGLPDAVIGLDDPFPGPPSFAETAPLLPEIASALNNNRADRRSFESGLRALEDWLRRGSADGIEVATAEWLRANLLNRLNRKQDALEAFDRLAKSGGAFSDDARLQLATLAPQRGPGAELEARAEWLVTRSPGAPGYLAGIAEAARIFKRMKKPERGVALLEQALSQAMNSALRTDVIVELADLYKAVGAPDKGIAVLRAYFWSNRSAPGSDLVKAMKAMKAEPGPDEDFLRRAIHAGRLGCRKLGKDMAKAKRPKRTPAWLAAEALGERWNDSAAALAALDMAVAAAKIDAKAPEILLARAMLLRRLNRDAEAVTVFADLAESHARHALAAEARDQAAVVLRRLGRVAEADAMDEDLLALAIAGPYHREALWRLGFAAVQRRETSIADKWLGELENRYGTEPDRHSFTWFERARYWRGRAAALGGRDGIAKAYWEGLLARYPAGWYALLARNRLGRGREANGVGGVWDIARDDPMATAIAWYRLGAEKKAMDSFEALMGAYQLPGNGRKLLADLLVVHGDAKKAARVLKFASIPPTMPGDDPAELYFAWYPMPHGEEVASAASGQGFPQHLLAGVVSVETRFNPKVKSSVGAIGLAQVMPSTGESVGRKIFGNDFKANQLWDPATNLTVAAKYLGDLLGRFGNNPALAVAAYNAGPTPVKRWLEERGSLELDAWVETIPYEEARRYVMRVLSDAEIYRRLYRLDRSPLLLPLKLGR